MDGIRLMDFEYKIQPGEEPRLDFCIHGKSVDAGCELTMV